MVTIWTTIAYRRCFLTATVVVTLLGCLSACQAAARDANGSYILVLNSYNRGLPAVDRLVGAIIGSLGTRQQDVNVVIRDVSTVRVVPDQEYFARLYRLYSYEFQSIHFAGVLCIGDDAFNFLTLYSDKLFPDTPVVFCDVNRTRVPVARQHPLYTGVFDDYDLKPNIELATELFPDARKIIFLRDQTTMGMQMANEVSSLARSFPDREFVLVDNLSFSSICEYTSTIPSNSVLFVLALTRDRLGRALDLPTVTGLVSKDSPVPVFGYRQIQLEHGIIGGYLGSVQTQGQIAARMLNRILAGEDVRSIPYVKHVPTHTMFDYRQMARFGVPLSALPSGSEVINRPVSIWDQYRNIVIAALVAFAVLLAIIIILSINIRRRKRAEAELRKSNRALTVLSCCNQALVRAQSEQDLLHDVCNIIVSSGDFRSAAMGFLQGKDPDRVSLATIAGDEDDIVSALIADRRGETTNHNPVVTAIATGQPVIINNLIAETPRAPWQNQAVSRGIASLAVLPVVTDTLVSGVLCILSSTPNRFDSMETRLLTELSADLSYGIAALRTSAERERVVNDLQDSEKRLLDIVSFLPDATLAIDADGRVTAWNREMENMTGIKAGSMLGKADYEYAIPFYGKRRPILVDYALRPGTIDSSLYQNISLVNGTLTAEVFIPNTQPGGRYLWAKATPLVDARGVVAGAIESIRDITELRRSMNQLRESEERYRLLFTHSPDIVFVLENERFIQVNDAIASVLGYTPEEVVGLTPWDISPDLQPDGVSSHTKAREWIEKAMRGEPQTFEWVHQHKNGASVFCEISLVAYTHHEQLYIQAIVRDITERKLAAEREREIHEQAEAQKRLFYRETIRSITSGKLEIIDEKDVNEFIRNAEQRMDANNALEATQARKRVELFCEDHGISGDSLAGFMTGVGEAITNAIKHGVRGHIYTGATEERVWVAIADEGKGIESLVLPHALLQRGFSTKPSLGMGYSIMLEVADEVMLKTDREGTVVVLVKRRKEEPLTPPLDQFPDTWEHIPT